MMKTIAEAMTERKLHSTPKTVTARRELVFNTNPETACTIPAGTKLEVYFSESRCSKIYFEYKGAVRCIDIRLAYKAVTGFSKPPGLATLERYDSDGVCTTPTGQRVEPDGTGPDGSPSWLKALGLM